MHLSCERLCKLAVVVFIKKATLLNKEHLKFDIGDYRGGGGVDHSQVWYLHLQEPSLIYMYLRINWGYS